MHAVINGKHTDKFTFLLDIKNVPSVHCIRVHNSSNKAYKKFEQSYSISSSVVIVSKNAYHLDSAHRDPNTHQP